MGAARIKPPREGERERVHRLFAMGPARCILVRGVLGWGMPMFVILSVLPAYGRVPWFRDTAQHPAVFILTGAVIFLTGGAVFGWLLWRGIAKRHAQLEADGGPR